MNTNKKRSNVQPIHLFPCGSDLLGRHVLLSLLTVVSALSATEAHGQRTNETSVPKVVINILIDQLRSDYLNAFMPLYGEDGFRKLLNEGRLYEQGEYPHARPDRASAAASIATGTTPSHHGIVGNRWLNRKTLRPVYCVEDPQHTGTGGSAEGASPQHLGVSTLGDELKVASDGKSIVYSIAPFQDAAILTAGHAADAVAWIDDTSGKWSSTSYYGILPSWASVRNQYHSITDKLASTWWQPSSDLVGTFSYFLSGGMKEPFKHKFKGDSRFASFKTSGLINEEVCSTAISCIENSMMGADAVTDYLTVTLYAGSYEHRPISEVGMELQDTYVRLDKSLSELVSCVEKKVGKDKALFVVTSTGYADEESADLSKYRIPTGSFDMKRAAALLNMYLVAVYGQGQYVEASLGTQFYLNHRLIESKQINQAELLERSQDFLLQLSGVKDVYTSQRMLQGAWTPGISRIRGGYNPQCSGDITIEVSPGWRYTNPDTRENVLVRETYIPFPIIFWGGNIQAEKINIPTTIDYIAPTLAKAMRIRAPNACSLPPLF